MSPFMQGLLGAGVGMVTFAAGIGVGKAGASESRPSTQEIRVVLPDGIKLDHRGIISDRAACLEWVSDHFKEPNVGQFSLMCGSGK
jgi:hypothetical protein